MFSGLHDLSRAATIQARGYDKIKMVMLKKPDLANLSTLLRPMGQLCLEGAPVETPKGPQTHGPVGTSADGGSKYPPIRIISGGRTRFQCSFPKCTVSRFSWGAVDAHVRRDHTGWRYGPCSTCKTFYSFNKDSFKNHKTKCENKNVGK